MIASKIGRRVLLGFILAGFLLAFATLWWIGRGGAISYEAAAPAIKKLLEHYIPLLAVLAGFYFSEKAMDSHGTATSIEAFVIASAIVGIWALGPPLLIVLSQTIEAALRLLDSVAVIGTSLASASLAFYFSKSAQGAPAGA